MKLASTAEFLTRSDGLRPLQQAYGFAFMSGNVVAMEPGAVYSALRRSDFDVGVVFSTDGRISATNLIILEDDRGFFSELSARPRRPPPQRRNGIPPSSQFWRACRRSWKMSPMAALQCSRRSGEPPGIRSVARTFLRSTALLGQR